MRRDTDVMPDLSRHLQAEGRRHPALTERLAGLLLEIGRTGQVIAREVTRAALVGRLGETGGTNVQGERVKKLDLWANEIMVASLTRSGLASALVSEEMAEPVRIEGAEPFTVCFDPVDGSSNTDINGIVGTLFGIRRAAAGDPALSALAPGTTQLAAGYLMYGPATVLVYTAGHGVHGLTLDDADGRYHLTHPDIRMPPHGKTYSVNDANWARWAPAVRAFIEALRANPNGVRPYSQRYVGALVADFHRTLLEGGIYLYPAEAAGERGAGKLRLLYEAAPLALVAEAAGGGASTGRERILDLTATAYHQRVPLLIGSTEEVEHVVRLYRAAPG
jgi:fructose-1,6-bisphosphatase I